VLSTHILEEVEAVCSRAVIVARGRIVTDGTPASLLAKSKYHNSVSLGVRPQAGVMIFDELAKVTGVAAVEDGGTIHEGGHSLVRCTIIAVGGKPIQDQIARHVGQRGWKVEWLHVQAGKLDDVFRQITAA
jgi:ABC-2 type transport system ATP-binding protein